ncbi:WD40 repeat-like protein [Neocallimastix lanati (nom. inval.)]|jgi:WD40 repeat protein|uniref:WD40 repeat-like protein n=1 Tax=Neocallimastix californiae TaxID=1754190 RepID=A0A1Y2AHT6_9FUNG|nr:WD40 repeat-like protein [Neocallimastix sp. JGI-2020a]ORY22163.1 WD40 repeat-like protein [Neocallimastix californiae]|eukprot:ORY22163.1 WD40 repeat-like protein [Neocallimastix californiae]
MKEATKSKAKGSKKKEEVKEEQSPVENTENALAPDAHEPPNGLYPLFLTSMTQTIFKIQADVDVTEENPVKLIPKVDIQSDLLARAGISDFSVIKQAILDSSLDEILVAYDPTYYYGQNYFACVTEEAVDSILHPPQPEEEKVEEKPKKERPPEWISLGSENEIDLEKVILNRDYIHVEISKKLIDFSKPCRFGDRDANDTYFEYKSFKDPGIEEIELLEINKGIQAIPELTEDSTQVDWYRPVNSSVQYEPRIFTEKDIENIINSDELINFSKSTIYTFEKAMQENDLINIFVDEFMDLGDEEMNIEHNMHVNLQEYQSFTDLQHSKNRPVICIDWHPTQMGILGVSCVKSMTFDERAATGLNVKLKDSLILIWSLFDPIHPLLLLEAPDDIMSFQFNPEYPNIIAGGCINGQVVLWDISEYQDKLKMTRKSKYNLSETLQSKEKNTETPIIKYIVVSSIEFSHKMAVTSLQWIPKHMEISSSGELLDEPCGEVNQLITGSLDGQVYFWDLRFKKEIKMLDLTWRPLLRFSISSLDNTYDYGILRINIQKQLIYESDKKKDKGKSLKFSEKTSDKNDDDDVEIDKKQLCKFFCGTEDGDLIYANWLSAETGEDKGSSSRVEHVFEGHYGPICDIKRSPFFPTIILSVGGKSFRIWKEGVSDGPLLISPLSACSLTSGEWSPTRPGVFFIGKRDGTIEIWDLIDRSNAPSSCQNISSTGVTFFTIHQYKNKNRTNRQFLASGDDEGTLHVIEIPKNLTKIKRNEKSVMKNFFEREESRLKYITERKAIRAKEKDSYDSEHTEVKADAATNGDVAQGAQGTQAQAQENQEDQQQDGNEMNDEEREALKLEEEFKEIEKNLNNDQEDLILSDEEGEQPKEHEQENNEIS